MITAPETETGVLSRLLQRLPRFGGQLDPDMPLREQGLDSMDTVELLCAVHEEFQVRLSESEYRPETTLRELAGTILLKLPS